MVIAVVGATGFIGRQVVRSLQERRIDVSALVRDHQFEAESVRVVRGDLRDEDSLDDLLRDASVVVHAASYVGADEDSQTEINVRGTGRLIQAAKRSPARRLVYISTAGIYGGLRDGGGEDDLEVAPQSTLSASRLQAEKMILHSQGLVIRPNAVLGAGDRWFLGPLVRSMVGANAWIENGTPRVSVVNVALLGEVVAHLAQREDVSGVYHVASRRPMPIRELVTPVYDALGVPLPERSISIGAARDLLRPHGVTESQLGMVARDNWFDTTKIWRELPDVESAFRLSDEDVQWYARELAHEGQKKR